MCLNSITSEVTHAEKNSFSFEHLSADFMQKSHICTHLSYKYKFQHYCEHILHILSCSSQLKMKWDNHTNGSLSQKIILKANHCVVYIKSDKNTKENNERTELKNLKPYFYTSKHLASYFRVNGFVWWVSESNPKTLLDNKTVWGI